MSDELATPPVCGRGTFFHAAPPNLPIDRDLGAPTGVWDADGKGARRVVWLFPLTLLLSVAIIASHPDPGSQAGSRLYGLATLPLIVLIVFLSARRAYEAVGPGWVYVRRMPFGPGKFIRFDSLVSADVIKRRNFPLTLVLISTGGTKIKFMPSVLKRNGPEFRGQLAHEVLRASIKSTPRAVDFLHEFSQPWNSTS